MTDRDADAAALAGAMGWTLDRDDFPNKWDAPSRLEFRTRFDSIPIPAADAPLGERFAFVGKLAEALWDGNPREVLVEFVGADGWCVQLGGGDRFAPDLVHAAIRAAIAAKGAT